MGPGDKQLSTTSGGERRQCGLITFFTRGWRCFMIEVGASITYWSTGTTEKFQRGQTSAVQRRQTGGSGICVPVGERLGEASTRIRGLLRRYDLISPVPAVSSPSSSSISSSSSSISSSSSTISSLSSSASSSSSSSESQSAERSCVTSRAKYVDSHVLRRRKANDPNWGNKKNIDWFHE